MGLRKRLRGRARRRARAAGYAHREAEYELQRRSQSHLLIETEHGVYCAPSAYRGMPRRLFVKGRSPDQSLLSQALLALEALGRKPAPDSAFVDVGANIGTATVFAIRACGFGRGLAFEPEPDNYRMLRVNLLLNGLEDQVETVNAAVSDCEGSLRLRTYTRLHGKHTIVPVRAGDRHAAVEVDSVTLDAALPRSGLSPEDVGLLWIDVEGHEPKVLAGADALIDRGVPVVIEYQPKALRKNGALEEFEDFVASRFDSIVDLGHPIGNGKHRSWRRLHGAEVGSLRSRYGNRKKGDLLLISEPTRLVKAA